ncbi:MAG: CheR family methyltransferase [Planctomycetota bacterium]
MSISSVDLKSELNFVVGIGASAGGLRSIELLLRDLDVDCNASFIIIQHLSPDVVSVMKDVLTRSTAMVVETIEDQKQLMPNTIYVMPPGYGVELEGAKFLLTKLDREELTRTVDKFLISLAENFGKKAIGIVLSGSGQDGAEGIKAIKASHGVTLVESFESAQFDSMPRSCHQTSCVDAVLEIPAIAQWINQQCNSPATPVALPSDTSPDSDEINRIFSLLSDAFEVDFSQYKEATIARRLERRHSLCEVDSNSEYLEFLDTNPDELEALHNDLLIGVTKFFRDSDAFNVLGKCIDDLVQNLSKGQTLRLWSAGCATGEEAYSLAMMAIDAFERFGKKINLKVFATDIHLGSLEVASDGRYREESMEFVTAEFRQKFFIEMEDGTFSVVPQLRGKMVFARHNVIHDPPFTQIHLVSCRNLLIYLLPDAQSQAIECFHFSLKKGGLLFLGSSESLGDLASEFQTVARSSKIYSKIRNLPSLLLGRTHSIPSKFGEKGIIRNPVKSLTSDRPQSFRPSQQLQCYESVLATLVANAIMVDDQKNVLHIFGNANQFLIQQPGRFTGHLNKFLPEHALTAVTAGILKSKKIHPEPVLLDCLPIDSNPIWSTIRLKITTVPNGDSNHFIHLIEMIDIDPSDSNLDKSKEVVSIDQLVGNDIRDLEAELVYTKDNLSAAIEEMEASNEELQVTNEELVAANEELQSTNEELHSVNEELYTVNQEHTRKINELQEITDDLEVLLNNFEVATLFLDANLKIRKFTTAVCDHFSLVPHDVGRPISNFRTNLKDIDDLYERLSEVRVTGKTYSRPVQSESGRTYLLKVDPHYSADQQLVGVIVNIIDRTHKLDLGISAKFGLPNRGAYWHWPDVKSGEMWWSNDCYELLQMKPDSIPQTFDGWKSLVHPGDLMALANVGTGMCQFVQQGYLILKMKCGDGQYRTFEFQAVFEMEVEDTPRSMTGYMIPVHD